MISVALPVGPFETDANWLLECLESLDKQTYPPKEILLLLDGSSKTVPGHVWARIQAYRRIHCYTSEWRLGCAAQWNRGVALAATDLVFLMGADDWLEPECLDRVVETYVRAYEKHGYYYCGVQYWDEHGKERQETQTLPCNAAAVTKSLWNLVGGFPPEAGLGAPDALLISAMMGRGAIAGKLVPVADGAPLYNVRRHPGQDTARQNKYHQQIIDVRNIYTATYQPATWTR